MEATDAYEIAGVKVGLFDTDTARFLMKRATGQANVQMPEKDALDTMRLFRAISALDFPTIEKISRRYKPAGVGSIGTLAERARSLPRVITDGDWRNTNEERLSDLCLHRVSWQYISVDSQVEALVFANIDMRMGQCGWGKPVCKSKIVCRTVIICGLPGKWTEWTYKYGPRCAVYTRSHGASSVDFILSNDYLRGTRDIEGIDCAHGIAVGVDEIRPHIRAEGF